VPRRSGLVSVLAREVSILKPAPTGGDLPYKMRKWHRVTLSAEEARDGKHVRLQRAFEPLFVRLGAPSEAGMFARWNGDSFDYFFSPGAIEIAESIIRAYGGVECEPPKASTLSVVVANIHGQDIPFASES
jgi:hypothetical protein